MRNKCYILLSILMLATVMPIMADDYLDDVYYWPYRSVKRQRGSQTTETTATTTTTEQPASVTSYDSFDPEKDDLTTRLTFLDDSITQSSDTVVRVVIHR